MISARFLGTGALGAHKGKNPLIKDYRRFPSLLIDEKIIIDPSEDIFEFAESFMLDGIYDGVQDVLITHSHPGHLSIGAIERLARRRRVRVYASDTLREELSEIAGVDFFPIYRFTPLRVAGYDIVPCPSNHKTDNHAECAFNFYISGEKAIFYGLDGAWLLSETFKFLKHAGADAFVMDLGGEVGNHGEECFYHNSLGMAKSLREALINSGAARQSAKFLLSHIPTVKNSPKHQQLEEELADFTDIKITYDGYYFCL